MKVSEGKKLILLGMILVVFDQVVKILVKTNMEIGDHFNVIGNWFQIYFIENEGMAFGMKFGGTVGKFLLSLFRIGLFALLWWWIATLFKKSVHPRAILRFDAQKKHVGKTSVTYHVDVYRRDIEASDEEHVFHTDITFVRVDEHGNKLAL